MPHTFSNAYSSGTVCRIDPKPGCKFEFVCCLETYLKNSIILGHAGPLRALFYERSSEFSVAGSILGSIEGSMKVQEGPLSLGRYPQ